MTKIVLRTITYLTTLIKHKLLNLFKLLIIIIFFVVFVD